MLYELMTISIDCELSKYLLKMEKSKNETEIRESVEKGNDIQS